MAEQLTSGEARGQDPSQLRAVLEYDTSAFEQSFGANGGHAASFVRGLQRKMRRLEENKHIKGDEHGDEFLSEARFDNDNQRTAIKRTLFHAKGGQEDISEPTQYDLSGLLRQPFSVLETRP